MCTTAIAGCDKDDDDAANPSNSAPNNPPVAKAGEDKSACETNFTFIELDGTGSTDPDRNITSYRWSFISGPPTYTLTNANVATAKVENLTTGTYVFELVVTDAGGLSSSDRVEVKVNSVNPQEYDLDISFTSLYNYTNDYDDGWGGNWDLTYAVATGSFSLGNYTVSITESANEIDTEYDSFTYIEILFPNGYFRGESTIKFKKMIQENGGPVKGTFNLYQLSCDRIEFIGIPADLPPLKVTGTLNKATKKINLRIVGKAIY
ncbi:hypothetical protein OI18_21830 [Flavihumibacter solisilvae]|uniref:PKD/Chitinase domain-containing protein n=2 Tax=Flavihumibacter solisilvae TaxID=1349421 RepID=A0A0C1LAS4_9BACT|nr:hypothetical protein OI18_21830 [Flavihumibacter solisilvae]